MRKRWWIMPSRQGDRLISRMELLAWKSVWFFPPDIITFFLQVVGEYKTQFSGLIATLQQGVIRTVATLYARLRGGIIRQIALYYKSTPFKLKKCEGEKGFFILHNWRAICLKEDILWNPSLVLFPLWQFCKKNIMEVASLKTPQWLEIPMKSFFI